MELGQIVLSKCGRDKKRYFIVVDIEESKEYVFIADGDLRKIENPKKKKIKHLVNIDINEDLKKNLQNGLKISNAELKKCLKSFDKESLKPFI